jgi:D-alanyl-D-alanine dipeptidase
MYNHFLLYGFLIICLCLVSSCESNQTTNSGSSTVSDTIVPVVTAVPTKADSSGQQTEIEEKKIELYTEAQLINMPDSTFVELLRVDTSFVLDMKYATEDNFLKSKVYDCDQCLLRVTVAKALAKAQQILKEKGYRIKLYDCYRPLDVQKRMWKIMPDDRYVGNPHGNGSVHNKGAAVDLTLVDSQGKELDMGTAFDHFGREAHHAYQNLPEEVLENRKLLKQTMEESGFKPITSEWWHYSYRNKNYPIANFKPSC